MQNDLYGDPMLCWAKQRIHAGSLAHPDREATQTNPLCGDRVTVQVKMSGETIETVRYQVKGCILCKASCACMASLISGMDKARAENLTEAFDLFLKSDETDRPEAGAAYTVFAPLRSHSSRHHCVLLPYRTLLTAVQGQGAGGP